MRSSATLPPAPAPLWPCSLLFLGFLLPIAYIWTTELRMRRQLLAQRPEQLRAPNGRPLSPDHLPGIYEFCMFVVPAIAAMWGFATQH